MFDNGFHVRSVAYGDRPTSRWVWEGLLRALRDVPVRSRPTSCSIRPRTGSLRTTADLGKYFEYAHVVLCDGYERAHKLRNLAVCPDEHCVVCIWLVHDCQWSVLLYFRRSMTKCLCVGVVMASMIVQSLEFSFLAR